MRHFKNVKHLQFLEARTVSKHPSFILERSSLFPSVTCIPLHLPLMYGLQALFLHTPSVGDGVAPALCEHLLFPITCWSPCWWEGIPWVCMHTDEVWVLLVASCTVSPLAGYRLGSLQHLMERMLCLAQVEVVMLAGWLWAVSHRSWLLLFPLQGVFLLLKMSCFFYTSVESFFVSEVSELPQLLFNPGDDCIPLQHHQLVVDDPSSLLTWSILGRCPPNKLVFGMCTHRECTLAFWPSQLLLPSPFVRGWL